MGDEVYMWWCLDIAFTLRILSRDVLSCTHCYSMIDWASQFVHDSGGLFMANFLM